MVLETKSKASKNGVGLKADTSSQVVGNRVVKFRNPCKTRGRQRNFRNPCENAG